MSLSLPNRVSHYFLIAARVAFALTVLLLPLRWRLDVWQRPFFPVYSDYTDFHLFGSDWTLLYMLVFWGCSLLVKPHRVRMGNGLIWICLTGLVVAGWVSVIGSVDPFLSRYHAARLLLLLFLYFFIVNEIHSPVWVIVPVMLQVIIQSMVAIGQSLAQSSLGLQILGEHSLDPVRSGVSVVIADGSRFLRAYGLSDHPNILGGCIAFGFVLMLAVVLYGNRRQHRLAAVVFLVAFPALVMTFSRSAWLSLMVAGSFMVGFEASARRWDSVKRAILLGVLSLLVVTPFITKNISLFQSRINSGNIAQDDQMRERVFLLGAGNTLFVEHAAIGIGLGASPLAMKNRFENFPLDFQPPHYAMLNAAMETGVFGGVFYLLLLIIPLIIFAVRWRDLISRPLVMGSLALLLAVFVVGLFDYYTWMYVPGRLWQWLGWGLFSAAVIRTT
ncbi:MAG: O-antigen ligase family protein [Anaerolineales bacterium]|nr:MAG: O-antigen ligase family protein [Anaerolineales bacterium]